MIKANELRIGNLVRLYGKPYKVTPRAIYDMHHEGASPVYGITITEEILLKCGFLECNIDTEKYFELVIDNANIKFLFTRGLLYVGFCGIGQYHFNKKAVKHLHQLQNLYFYLTGQELNIEL